MVQIEQAAILAGSIVRLNRQETGGKRLGQDWLKLDNSRSYTVTSVRHSPLHTHWGPGLGLNGGGVREQSTAKKDSSFSSSGTFVKETKHCCTRSAQHNHLLSTSISQHCLQRQLSMGLVTHHHHCRHSCSFWQKTGSPVSRKKLSSTCNRNATNPTISTL